MKLVERVEDLLVQIEAQEPKSTSALERAERLSDQYRDVKPVPYKVPIEQSLGLPAFTK
ncbi:MAG: hypothetical protein ACPGOV_03890 [Magnetovibrionaceae bacterium]